LASILSYLENLKDRKLNYKRKFAFYYVMIIFFGGGYGLNASAL